MSFAQEVKTVSAERSKSEVLPATAVAAAPESSAKEFSFEQVTPTTQAAEASKPAEAAPATESPKAAKVKIGAKEFDSMEAALAYAQEADMALLERDAYDRGKQEATPKPAEQPKKTFGEEVEEIIFENPKEAVSKIEKRMGEIVEAKAAAIQAEQARVAQLNKTWSGFYESNPELQDSKAFVEYILQREWNQLGNMDVSKSLPILAEKARQELRIKRAEGLPETVLPAGRATVAPSSGSATPQIVTKEEAPIDFVKQINNLRKRTKA